MSEEWEDKCVVSYPEATERLGKQGGSQGSRHTVSNEGNLCSKIIFSHDDVGMLHVQ